ncbi:hypothetical protein BJF86_15715 [Serinicoccus sp. CNJ-927]|uniref:hypothetical protein n=1 Tax=Serinicoccus sp. CNJ-927 TaxID=1904970 RepID=UPI000969C722|nr:hypothetical protein [Serinicoccus sp. CNJ-927]OLT41395.1 hypothetical protein BJF86_15715 [Serinicoccus sp. CNJ-927]
MTESRDTWTTRDYPVLVDLAEHLDASGLPAQPHTLSVQGLDREQITRAFVALIGGNYIEGQHVTDYDGQTDAIASGLTEKGRRAAGLWPAEGTDHTLALVEALRAAAEQAETDDERSKLRKAADALAEVFQR